MPATVTNSAVTLNAPAAGERSGSYVYDFASGRLLRVSDTASDLGIGGQASGDDRERRSPLRPG